MVVVPVIDLKDGKSFAMIDGLKVYGPSEAFKDGTTLKYTIFTSKEGNRYGVLAREVSVKNVELI